MTGYTQEDLELRIRDALRKESWAKRRMAEKLADLQDLAGVAMGRPVGQRPQYHEVVAWLSDQAKREKVNADGTG